MATTIKFKRGTAASFTSGNPILSTGEPGFETDTNKLKIGDGATAWNSLAYQGGGGAFTDLSDAPASYSGEAGKVVSVKGDETGLEFTTGTGGTTVYAGMATLSSGSVTVPAAWVTAGTIIIATPQAAPGTPGTVIYVDPANIVVSTSFDISSDDGTDSRDVFWHAVVPAVVNTNVMMIDCTANTDSYVTKDWGSDENEIWLTFDLAFTAATLTYWEGNSYGSGYFSEVDSSVNAAVISMSEFTDVVAIYGITGTGGDAEGGTPATDSWHTFEQHVSISGGTTTVELYIDTVLACTSNDNAVVNVPRKVHLGQLSALMDADSICYIRNLKVGTTQGGSDLFGDDFSSGDLSNWDATTGACSVVTDPF